MNYVSILHAPAVQYPVHYTVMLAWVDVAIASMLVCRVTNTTSLVLNCKESLMSSFDDEDEA